jgi:diguanylate cyclase (GGDEF)-like protein
VAGTPWRLRASVSTRQLLAPVGGARIWLPWLILAGLAVLGAVAVALAGRQRRAVQLLREAHADVTHQATHDPLTGLWNRRRFEEELVRTVGRAHRYGVGASLLVLDLDGFKAVNDTLGHHVGDELIKAVGGAIQRRVRSTDGVARLGGDEFAVLLVHVDPEEASAIAESVAEAVRTATVVAGDAVVSATTSIGIAHIDRDSGDHQDVLISADRAMYAAKAAGRDRAQAVAYAYRSEPAPAP